jgi:hypothetical protein
MTQGIATRLIEALVSRQALTAAIACPWHSLRLPQSPAAQCTARAVQHRKVEAAEPNRPVPIVTLRHGHRLAAQSTLAVQPVRPDP